MDAYNDLLSGTLDIEDYDNPFAYYHVIGLEYSLLVFHISLICLTIIGNIYMIYFICGQKKARTTHNITIVSIAVASILIAAFVQPIYLVLYLNTSPEIQKAPFFLCKMMRKLYFIFLCNMVSKALRIIDLVLRNPEPLNHTLI